MKRLILFVVLIVTLPMIAHSRLAYLGGSADKQFTYTAPGDNGSVGQASIVVLRTALTLDSLQNNWDDCTILVDKYPPIAGTVDTLTVQYDFVTGVKYFFAMKAADEVPNWSLLSNIISVVYPDTLPPDPITDLQFGAPQ